MIVSVTADKFIEKGLGRPYFNERIRMEMLSNLEVVDAVVLSNNFSARESIIKKLSQIIIILKDKTIKTILKINQEEFTKKKMRWKNMEEKLFIQMK